MFVRTNTLLPPLAPLPICIASFASFGRTTNAKPPPPNAPFKSSSSEINVVSVTKTAAPSEMPVAPVVCTIPASFVLLGAVDVTPPENVDESVTSLPISTTPVLRNVVAPPTTLTAPCSFTPYV